MNNLQLNNALLEILLNIGTSFELETTVQDALTSYLRQLDCSGVILFEQNDNKYNLHTAKPKIFKNDSTILEIIINIETNIETIKKEYFNKDLPYFISKYDAHYYINELKGFGLIMFIKNHTTFEVNTCKALIPINKKFTHSLISCRNIEQKDIKDKLLYEQSKMATMGEMIGNIAHQWRQPLSVISTCATGTMMLKELNDLTDDIFFKNMLTINKNAQYLSKTIDDFKNFIKGDRSKKNFNLKDVINSFIQLVEGSIKNHQIKLVVETDHNINMFGFPNELIQCFINIFNNSKDALNDFNEEDRLIFIKVKEKKDDVVITFKDSAGGIPKDILTKIFNPYFTTKHQSQGTGLGLHMTYNLIVDGSDGNIQASNIHFKYNEKNYKGTKFTITLPNNKNY